jgi:hypothetical protein
MLTESNAETSPEGVQNATKIIRNAVYGNSAWLAFFNQGSVGNNVVYSAFAKAGTNSQLCITYYDSFTTDMFFNFDLVNGQIASVPTGSAYYVDAGIEDYGNGWYRCYAVVDSQQSTAQYQLSAGGNRGGQINEYIYVYGAMSEIGSYPTSYIPTYGTSVTRAGEVFGGAGDSSTFNDSEGVLYAEIEAFANDGTNRVITISDGTTSNRVQIYFNYSNGITGGVAGQAVISFSGDFTQNTKLAFKYKVNDFALWVNGIEVGTDIVGSAPTGLNVINFDNGASGSNFYGNTKQLIYFPTALSDSELATLTTI